MSRVRSFAAEMYRRWCSHHGGALAAEMLLFGVLSALPLLLSLTALFGSLQSIVGEGTAGRFEEWVLTQVAKVVGRESPAIEVVEQLFVSSAKGTLTLSLVIAVYAASRASISLVGALDTVYGITETRTWWGRRLVGVGLTLAGMITLPLVVVALYGGRRIAESLVSSATAQHTIGTAVGALGYVLSILWVMALYKWAPKRRATWRSQIPGALAAVALVAAWTSVFRWYVAGVGSNAVFGTIGAVISLLWWGYFCASSFVFGAELNEWIREKRSLPESSALE